MPKRRPAAILSVSSSIRSPRFEIRSALNHAPVSLSEAALRRARERSSGALLNNELEYD